jgi:hypothetical protein
MVVNTALLYCCICNAKKFIRKQSSLLAEKDNLVIKNIRQLSEFFSCGKISEFCGEKKTNFRLFEKKIRQSILIDYLFMVHDL